MNLVQQVVPLEPSSADHTRAAARLHAELLPESLIPRLGDHFMRRFYYSTLVNDGLIRCDLLQDEAGYAAFIAYSSQPYTFMSEGARRHLIRLGLLTGLAVLQSPGRLKTLWEVRTTGSQRRQHVEEQNLGEILSFGVLPSHRDRRDDATGLKVSNYLFERAVLELQREGVTALQMLVHQRNLLALLFYKSYGATMVHSTLGPANHYACRIDLAGFNSSLQE